MKKIIWVIVGVAVLIGAGLLIGRERAQKEISTEYTEHTETGEVRREGLTTKDTKYTKVESVQSEGSPALRGGTIGQTGKSAPQVSEAVKALVGLDGKKHNYPSLLAAINELDQEMSAADVAALMEMLNFANDRFPEKMRPIEINAVKNDVLDKLLRQKEPPKGLGLQLVEMAGNADNDPVWRDYCMQFFPMAWERIDAEYRISNREFRRMGLEGLEMWSRLSCLLNLRKGRLESLPHMANYLQSTMRCSKHWMNGTAPSPGLP